MATATNPVSLNHELNLALTRILAQQGALVQGEYVIEQGGTTGVQVASKRHMTLVFDTSSSTGWEDLTTGTTCIDNLRPAALELVDSLDNGEVVTLIQFASSHDVLFENTVLDDKTREQVRNAITGLRSSGGTVMGPPMATAVDSIRDFKRQSDGPNYAYGLTFFGDGESQAHNKAADLEDYYTQGENLAELGVSTLYCFSGSQYTASVAMEVQRRTAQAGGLSRYIHVDGTQTSMSGEFQKQATQMTSLVTDVEVKFQPVVGFEIAKIMRLQPEVVDFTSAVGQPEFVDHAGIINVDFGLPYVVAFKLTDPSAIKVGGTAQTVALVTVQYVYDQKSWTDTFEIQAEFTDNPASIVKGAASVLQTLRTANTQWQAVSEFYNLTVAQETGNQGAIQAAQTKFQQLSQGAARAGLDPELINLLDGMTVGGHGVDRATGLSMMNQMSQVNPRNLLDGLDAD